MAMFADSVINDCLCQSTKRFVIQEQIVMHYIYGGWLMTWFSLCYYCGSFSYSVNNSIFQINWLYFCIYHVQRKILLDKTTQKNHIKPSTRNGSKQFLHLISNKANNTNKTFTPPPPTHTTHNQVYNRTKHLFMR